jgi:hypothetical protein
MQEVSVIVSKTALGVQVMKDRSVSLTGQQRSALILVDGKRSADDVVRMTAGVGVSMEDIQALIELGLVESSGPAVTTPEPVTQPVASTPNTLPEPALTTVDFQAALNAAITLCANLGFKGFSLNMALTGVDSLEKLQKLAPEIRRVAGDAKYAPLHALIFGK